MKRQATKQLAKDDDEEEEVDETPGQGFKKADEFVLATRVIRGLPKRAGATPEGGRASADATTKIPPSLFGMNPPSESGSFKTTPTPQTTNTSSSPFSGFSFKPAVDTSKQTSTPANSFFSAPSSSSFTSTPPQPVSSFTPSSNPFSSGTSTSTNTSKTFASLLGTSSTPSSTFGSAPASQTKGPTSSASSSTESGRDDSVPTKFYTNLRGLNMSLLSAISKEVESDPFVDVSTFLEKYLSLRSKIQKDYNDESSTSSESKPTTDTSSTIKPAMPAPPTSFSGFDGVKTPTPAPTTTEPKPTNLFDFKSSASSNTGNPFAPVKDSPSASSSFGGFSFSSPATSSTTTSSAFTFGSSPDKGSTNPSPFGTFGTFGASVPPANFTIGSSSSQSSSSPPKSVFGSSSSSTFSFGSNTNKPASSNIFGNAEKAPSTPSAFQIPPKDTTTNPVQFGFGSYTAGSSSFGTKVATESAAATEEKQTEGDNSDRGTPTTEGGDPATANLIASGPNLHDEEGEGEENEETAHSIKAKAYRLTKAEEEGGVKWVILGAGILRLKKDKNTGSRRVLLRNSTNGKVIMNFNIYSGLKPTQTKAALSFVGHDAGVSQTYSVRLSNEEDAKQLKGALDREIAFVKAKEES